MSDNKDARKFNTFPEIETLSDDGVFLVGQMINGVKKFRQFTKAGFVAQFISGGGSSTLADLTDVLLVNLQNKDVLRYNLSSEKWENVPDFISLSVAEAQALQQADGLIPNCKYFITDAIGGQQQIIVTALTENTFSFFGTNISGELWYYLAEDDSGFWGSNGEQVSFYVNPENNVPAYKEGVLFYDNANKTLSFYDNIEGTLNQINHEQTIRARNATGILITNGTAVYINGAIGQNPTLGIASASDFATSQLIGIATHDIADNTIGKVTTFGIVEGLDTSAFGDGDIIYLSINQGELTNIKPTPPEQIVQVGICIHSHPTQGKIFVNINRIFEPSYLLTTTPADILNLLNNSLLTPGQMYLVVNAGDGSTDAIVIATASDAYTCFVDAYNNLITYDIYTDTIEYKVETSELTLSAGSSNPSVGQRGKMWYNFNFDTIMFYDVDYNNPNLTNREITQFVYNDSGSTIAKGELLYINSHNSTKPTIRKARANSLSTSNVCGIAFTEIANTIGSRKIMTNGIISGLNTSSFANGDILYLSPDTAGAITNVKPTSPNYVVKIGVCVYSHASNGKIFLKISEPQLGLGTAGQVLAVNGTATAEEWQTIFQSGTFTPIIKINNTTTGISQSVFQGHYTKIGDLVFIQMFIAITSKGVAVGSVTIDELPFTNVRETAFEIMPIIGQGFANNNYKQVVAYTNSKTMYLTDNYAQMTNTSLTDTTAFRVSGCYKTT